MFTKEERAGFKYTFAHWCAYQMTALNLGVWKFKYLFHDVEKPWLKLIWKDYSKVQKWHRQHNSHHLEYKSKNYDFEAMVIDWECSRFTKEASPMTAYEKYLDYCNKNNNYKELLTTNMLPILKKLNLTK